MSSAPPSTSARDRTASPLIGSSPTPIVVEAGPDGINRVRMGTAVDAAWGPTPEAGRMALAGLAQLREYLAGRRRTFELPLDLRCATPFRRKVLEALQEVPWGETVTYGELARTVGSSSPRAVGQAVGWNPIPIVIPCHRVIAGGGKLGGYSGGLDRKRFLLSLECVHLPG
jgi:methylated-DNA-[protein]-cysteine S-methyltransferase